MPDNANNMQKSDIWQIHMLLLTFTFIFLGALAALYLPWWLAVQTKPYLTFLPDLQTYLTYLIYLPDLPTWPTHYNIKDPDI